METMSDTNGKRRAAIKCTAAALVCIIIFIVMFVIRAVKFPEMPFFRGMSAAYRELGYFGGFALGAGIVMLILSIRDLMRYSRENIRAPYWQTGSKLRLKSVLAAVAAENDTAALQTICQNAPREEVKEAAHQRIKALATEKRNALNALLNAQDREGVRKKIDELAGRPMDTEEANFLAAAAKQYPELVKRYWPNFEAWAHEDSNTHSDTMNDIYHVRNQAGHRDSNTHSDCISSDKLMRFRPVLPADKNRNS